VPGETAYVNGFVDGDSLVLLYRDETGRLMARRKRAEWSNFFRTADLKDQVLRDLRNSRNVAGISVEGEWTRVRWKTPEERRRIFGLDRGDDARDYFKEELGIEAFEADVDPIRRFFSDTGAAVARPKRVYLDIETDPRISPVLARQGKARVLCWTLVGEDEKVVAQGVLEDWSDEAEAKLLEHLWESADPFDQIVAWYGDGFDFPVIRKRSEVCGARTKDLRRWLFIDQMEVFERNNKNSAESGDEKVSLKLQDVAMAKLGRGKKEFDVLKGFEFWEAGGEKRAQLLAYCAEDTLLLPGIERETGYLALNDAVCEVCRLFGDTKSAGPAYFVDGFMLRLGVEKGIHFPTRKWASDDDPSRKKKNFKGAWVMEPTRKGIVRDVHVADFSGMYPSIIETWNMSPETKRDRPINGPISPGCCRAPSTRVSFALEPQGILSYAVEQIGKLRKVWSKKQAALPPGTPEWRYAGGLSMAFKVVRNSFYGVATSPASRYCDVQIGESITQNGVWLIQMTISEGDRRGIEAIYGDTDALNATNTTRERFSEFVEWCNRDLYPPAIAETGCTKNLVEIAYEKEFERIVYVSAKRYAGAWRHYKWTTTCTCDVVKRGKSQPGEFDVRTMTCRDCGAKRETLPPIRSEPEVKGLEYKRGDAALLARKLQWDCIQKLMVDFSEGPSDFEPIVERVRDHVLNDPLPVKEVQLSKSISKSLREYATKTKLDGTQTADLPHVQVGKILRDRGEQIVEGTRIAYYVVDASTSPMKVAPAVDYAGECDRHYIWESLVWPATKRLLEAAFPTHDWSRYDRTRPKKERGASKTQGTLDSNPGSRPARAAKPSAPGQGSLFELPSPAASAGHAEKDRGRELGGPTGGGGEDPGGSSESRILRTLETVGRGG
jgi:DNA polymerase elongation subunit (family B)